MGNFQLWGTVFNSVLVAVGALLGLLIHLLVGHAKRLGTGKRDLGHELSSAVMTGLAFCTLLIGIEGALKVRDILVVILSVAIGSAVGTLLDLDGKFVRLGDWIGTKMGARFGNVSKGFVSASLLFCVGAMAVTGSLESGLWGNHETLYAKSMIDFVAAIVLASALGFGVMLSAASVFLYQGTITLLATFVQPYMPEAVIDEMGAVGSLLVIGVALNMLELTRIKLMNLVPAIFLPILLCSFI